MAAASAFDAFQLCHQSGFAGISTHAKVRAKAR